MIPFHQASSHLAPPDAFCYGGASTFSRGIFQISPENANSPVSFLFFATPGFHPTSSNLPKQDSIAGFVQTNFTQSNARISTLAKGLFKQTRHLHTGDRKFVQTNYLPMSATANSALDSLFEQTTRSHSNRQWFVQTNSPRQPKSCLAHRLQTSPPSSPPSASKNPALAGFCVYGLTEMEF